MNRFLTGIPQGSVLGPHIFNIFINNLIAFIEITDICNFADDNALYKSSPKLSVVLKCLERGIWIVLNWFKVNPLKANPPKFQFMILDGGKFSQYKCKIEDSYFFFFKDKVVVFGISIDNKLTFEAHLENLCKQTSHKHHTSYMP